MTENDFFVAIQFILEDAKNKGWSLRKIEETAVDAVEEFIDECEAQELDDE